MQLKFVPNKLSVLRSGRKISFDAAGIGLEGEADLSGIGLEGKGDDGLYSLSDTSVRGLDYKSYRGHDDVLFRDFIRWCNILRFEVKERIIPIEL